MAAQPAPTSEAKGFSVLDHVRRIFGGGPQNWGTSTTAAGSGARPSGANLTLNDLSRDPKSIVFYGDDDPVAKAAIEDDSGWVGIPDPTKFAPGTSHLSPKELKEEVAKGNVMLWKDFKTAFDQLTGEEADQMAELAERVVLNERRFVTLKDGTKVSLWDLYQYVGNNPELQALAESGRRIPVMDPTDPAGRPLPGAGSFLPPEARSGSLPVAVVTPQEAEELGLDWGRLGSGDVWRRRPTRWLGGLDGLKDWDVDVFANETMANQVLGAKYGGRDPYEAVQDPSYASDFLRCGPLLGMTFVLTAARDMHLKEVANSFRDALSARLQRQAPLTLPRRLRPTSVDPTDLNGATWPLLFPQDTVLPSTPDQHPHHPHQLLLRKQQELLLRQGGSQSQSQALLPAPSSSRTGLAAGDDGDEEQHLASAAAALRLVLDAQEAGCDELGVSWQLMGAVEHQQAVEEGLRALRALPEALCPGPDPASWPLAGTALVDEARGTHWRKGAALWVTLQPEGGLLLQGSSGGLLSSAQSYELARLAGQEALVGAVADAFLGPQPVDPEMAAAARAMALLPANGYSISNKEGDPNHPACYTYPGEVPLPVPRAPRRLSAYRFVPRSRMEALLPGQGGLLLGGIREAGVADQLQDLLERAARAAADAAASAPTPTTDPTASRPAHAAATQVSEGTTQDDVEAELEAAVASQQHLLTQLRAREAAAAVLREGLAALGPDGRRVLYRTALAVASPSGTGLLPAVRDAIKGATEEEKQQRQEVGVGPDVIVSDLFSLARCLEAEREGGVEQAV